VLSYDFFLAHAGPDNTVAERLFDLLVAETRVFLDSRSLVLGDDWDRALAEAQRGSRVTVVLVSANTDVAFYQREEIAAAIDLARKGGTDHRVVPVYLGLAPVDVPYGLRLKHGLAVSNQLPIEQVAARLLDLHRTLVAQANGPAAEHVATPPLAQALSRAELIGQLFDRDPVVSLPAVAGLSELGPSIIPDVVSRLSGLNQVNIIVLRTLLGRFPQESGLLMADRILDAHRDWHGVTLIPDCFTPLHRPFCANLLASHLDDMEPDVVRKCIESLGFMAAETWGYRLVELILSSSRYEYDKFATYVILARARMLVLLEADQVEQSWQLPATFSDVEQVIAEASRRGWQSIQYRLLQGVLAKCQPRHADHLITSWLTADLVERRALAARALGQMRLQRSLPYLVSLARSASEVHQVRHQAAFAIANIGGPDAVAALDDLLSAGREDEQRSGDLRWALAHCLADASDDGQFARLAGDILAHPPSEVSFVHRAIGLRHDERFTSELRRGLEGTDPAVRGQSALALARIGDTKTPSTLIRAITEAANGQERILASLGLLLIGQPVPGDPELRQTRADLSEESFLYKRLITDDIVQVLSISQHPQAGPIAEAWQGIYATLEDY
jgi:hypothetical protein